MRILFICGSAEPGNDGVGDYTRRLCGALIRAGHQAQILSICDLYVNAFAKESQEVEGTQVLVNRIPFETFKAQRGIATQEAVDAFEPDWISLQFVPYSYHPQGLPYWLPEFLKRLKGRQQWHIMFHELWIGIEREASFKKKCVGLLQKRIIQRLYKSTSPKVVHTQAQIYQYYLSTIAIDSLYLPLFGNVAVTAMKKKDSEKIVFVVFATIHNKSPFEDFIIDLMKELESSDKQVQFQFIGRNGDLLPSWLGILEKHGIEFVVLGPSSEAKISQVLRDGSYGISTTPYKISDKSGVVSAMRDHQLPIISVAKPWTDRKDLGVQFDDIFHYQKANLNLSFFFNKYKNSLDTVCENFLNTFH